jgi:hypothetical protein
VRGVSKIKKDEVTCKLAVRCAGVDVGRGTHTVTYARGVGRVRAQRGTSTRRGTNACGDDVRAQRGMSTRRGTSTREATYAPAWD